MFFVQTSTLPARMHQNLTKHGRFCKENNQLPTKSHVELKDNSIVTLIPNEEEFPHRCGQEEKWATKEAWEGRDLAEHKCDLTKGLTTHTTVNSHLCVMIGASAALSQSQHIGVSHYHPVWLRAKRMSVSWEKVAI